MKAVIFAAVTLVMSAISAAAQTAEETTAFLMFGLEDGRVVTRNDGNVLVHQITASPASYSIEGFERLENPKMRAVAVKRESQCQFEFSVTDAGGGVTTTAIDFAKLTKVSEVGVDASILAYEFRDRCAVKTGQRCSSVRLVLLGELLPDRDRYDNALAYFRKNFCAGSAF